MSNVVNFKRKEESVDVEVLDFIKNKKCIVLTFDEESDNIDILSNMVPGIKEATMLHFSYLHAVDIAMGMMEDD
jgi:hypothetical protein